MSQVENIKKQLDSIEDLNFKYLGKDLHDQSIITFEFSQQSIDLKEKLVATFKNISFKDIGIFNYIENKSWAKGSMHRAFLKMQ